MTDYRISWIASGVRKSIKVHTLHAAKTLVETLDQQGAYDVVLTTNKTTFNEMVITFDHSGPRIS